MNNRPDVAGRSMTIAQAIREIQAGHMVLICDDESREHEADLCLAAQFATPEAINFMVRSACGLICNEQEHFAHRKRTDGRRTPQDVLGWVKGREIDPAKLDDAFTLRRVRQLDQRGYVRFQNWRIYAKAGLARRPADLWICNETLSIQFTTTLLAKYAVHYHMASHRLLEVGTYQAFPSPYQSPQLSLWQDEDIVWRPAYKLDAPPRRSSRRRLAMIQDRLFSEEAE